MTKRVNILLREIRDETGNITQKGNVILRVSARLAANQVAKGYAVYTSKQKLKSVMKRERTIENNLRWLKGHGLKIKDGKIVDKNEFPRVDIYRDPSNGKVHTYLPMRRNSTIIRVMNLAFEERTMPIEW